MVQKLLRHKILVSGALVIILIGGIFGFLQVQMLQKAHSTFDNYYAFRGCTELLQRTSTYGVCRTKSGKVITIVLYQGKWYLQNDLPTGILRHLL